MLKYLITIPFLALLSMGCEPTDLELCEASDTCEVTGDGDFQCLSGMKWTDLSDPTNFTCQGCEEGQKWEDAKDPENMKCVPICTYPEEFYDYGMSLGKVSPPFAWTDALLADGTPQSFDFESFYCDDNPDEIALIVVVVATWCGYCPDYVQMVNQNAGAIKTGGGRIIYVVAQGPDRSPASHEVARNYINGYIGADNTEHPGLRVGDGTTRWQYDDGKVSEDKAGGVYASPDISGIPSAFVIRKDTMEVIESQGLSQYTLNFVNILSDLRSGAYDSE